MGCAGRIFRSLLPVLLMLSTASSVAQSTNTAQIIKQAKDGNAKAQTRLGEMYAIGRGVSRDEAKAVRWLLKAAEQGNTEAQCFLGGMYQDGKGIPKDDAEATRWYRKAAEQGDANAQFLLGFAYANGQGLPTNKLEAIHWYSKAAEQGDATAQYNLGVMYENGEGVPPNEAEAVLWWRKAAQHGLAEAQLLLRNRGIEQESTTVAPPNSTRVGTARTNSQGFRGARPSFLGFLGGQSRATVEANAQAQGFDSLNCERGDGKEECSSSKGLGDDNIVLQFTFVYGKMGKLIAAFSHSKYQSMLAALTEHNNGSVFHQEYSTVTGGTNTTWSDKEKNKYVILWEHVQGSGSNSCAVLLGSLKLIP
jgi:TPR repeat protein